MQNFGENIFFVGAGNMGGAILCALAESVCPAKSISFYEPNEEQANKIAEKSKAKKTLSLSEGSEADIIFLCVKPQVFPKISASLNAKIIISIMAGVSISALQAAFPKSIIVRAMPNIAVVAKKGTVAIATDNVPENALQTVEELFSASANTVRVLENQMDAVTGLSGSGPAFAFQFIEALAMGGVKMGLPRDIAIKLATSTVCGSAEMLKQSKAGPGELTANVCSPAGTTIAGLQELETKAFKGTVMAAVEAAAKRSAELGKILSLILALFLTATLYAKAPNQGHLDMCSGVKQCLNYDFSQCSAEDKKPNPNIKYNAEFCAPYIELRQRGLQVTSHVANYNLFRYLGRQYRVTYKLNGTLPVSKETMIYLFDNMEFTAQLVNAYRKTKYSITYENNDKKRFNGNSGDNMSGRFHWLLSDSADVDPGMHHVFFGWGKTKILVWNLQGTATAILDLREINKDSVAYEFRAIVSPSGAVLNSIMNLGYFNNKVKEIIKDIVDNIEKSASEFANGNRKPIENYAIFKDKKWKKNLQEFEQVTKK